jgi:ATP adenylyltransferase
MEYILGPKSDGCIFCDFAGLPPEEHPAKLVLLVQPHALVCLNRFPFSSAHLLVAPRRHVAQLADLPLDEYPLDEYEATMRLVREAAIRLKQATSAEGLNIGINLGRAAGAGIADHMHVHIVARWAGDSNFMPVIADGRIMPEYLADSYQRLRGAFDDLEGVHPLAD